MSSNSNIEWTDATWNPVRGCTKISDGCKHCYAETFAERFRGVKGHPYQQGFDLRLVTEKLAEPLRWRNPKMIFVNSMSDLFHENVPEDYVVAVAKVMVAAKWHTYQVLTKRSERLQKLLNTSLRFAANQEHIWWGVSVENRKYGLPRIENLQNTDAAMRFLSVEPLLEDLGKFDLIYCTGLYDYLQMPSAQRLTASLFRSLRPRGKLLIANFLPGILDVGFMEAYMAWKLIFRKRQEMLEIAEEIPLAEIHDIRIFAEENQNIIFLKVTKR